MEFLTFKLRSGREVLLHRDNIEALRETETQRGGVYTTNIVGISGTIYDVDETPEKVYAKILASYSAETSNDPCKDG
jgi:hypothetical protein